MVSCQIEVTKTPAPETLSDVELVGRWMAYEVEPRFAIEPGRVDHQYVLLPSADRIPQPGGISVVRQRSAIQKNLAVFPKGFIENYHQTRLLDDLDRMYGSAHVQHGDAWWQKMSGRPCNSPRRPVLAERLRPRLDRKLARLEIRS